MTFQSICALVLAYPSHIQTGTCCQVENHADEFKWIGFFPTKVPPKHSDYISKQTSLPLSISIRIRLSAPKGSPKGSQLSSIPVYVLKVLLHFNFFFEFVLWVFGNRFCCSISTEDYKNILSDRRLAMQRLFQLCFLRKKTMLLASNWT